MSQGLRLIKSYVYEAKKERKIKEITEGITVCERAG